MKILKIFIFLSLFLLQAFNCSGQIEKIKSPENLEEGILYFQQNWTKGELQNFKQKSENEAIAETHFGPAMWVRNNWVRGNRNQKFYNYFKKMGISSPDDISSILFISLHRRLNKKNIDLDSQIEKYNKYWNERNECNKKLTNKSLEYYNRYEVGDKITILMPVNFSYEERNAVLYKCPNTEWNFDDKKDLKFTAEIEKKYYINSKQNVFFKLKILEMNYPNTIILGQSASQNTSLDLNLDGLKIQ